MTIKLFKNESLRNI